MRIFNLAICLVSVFFLFSSEAQAGSTGWIDIAKRGSFDAAIKKAQKEIGPYSAYKRVKCKVETGRIYMNIFYNTIWADGFYGIRFGTSKAIDDFIAQSKKKRSGFSVPSRSNVELGGEKYSCIIWHKPV